MNQSVYKIFKSSRNVRELFEPFRDDSDSFLLESSADIRGMGRYSFFGSEPFLRVSYQNGRCLVSDGQRVSSMGPHPLPVLRDLLKRYELKINRKNSIPLLCGAIGFLSYDLGFAFERVKRTHRPDVIVPDMLFGFYDTVVCVDHKKSEVLIFSSGFPEKGARRRHRASERLTAVLAKLEKGARRIFIPNAKSGLRGAGEQVYLRPESLTSNFTKKDYEAAIRQAQAYIARGDIYQVNLSQKFKTDFCGDDWALYCRLVKNFPVSFSAFLSAKGACLPVRQGFASGGKNSDFSILSASPEKFLSFDGHRVTTRPMKGTRKRTGSALKDKRYKNDLIQSAKEKAELLMIVDLERNDLGRVCDYGSIRVNRLREIEAYQGVFQATADISGVLHKGKDRCDLIRACFPGGSVTGCPKIRAMEIIEELEPEARAIYTGSLGFLSFHNTMELNVLIRSFLKKRNEISFHVGGGIVSDSKPASEYEETLIKGRALIKSLMGR